MHPTSSSNNFLFRTITTLFLVASVAYLVYQMYHFTGYDDLLMALKENFGKNAKWLIAVVALLPFNWLIEAMKWKKVCSHLEELRVSTALKAVLAGASVGFVTPNRIGDILGRMNFLQPSNRKSAISLAAVNSLTQNIAILLLGIPLAFIFFMQQQIEIKASAYIISLTVSLLLFLMLLLWLPLLARRMTNKRLQPYFRGLLDYSILDIVTITGWSLLRFMTFSTQLYLMLGFLGVALSAIQALTSIPVTYLLVTFTPSFAFSEALIRSSWAVFIIGQFNTDTPAILMAGVGLWLINVVIPMLIGSGIIGLKSRCTKHLLS